MINKFLFVFFVFVSFINATEKPLFPHIGNIISESELEVVFSRIENDQEVLFYEAVFADNRIMSLENNFLVIRSVDFYNQENISVSFRAVFRDGTIGAESDKIVINKASLIAPNSRNIDQVLPSSVYSPVYGAIKLVYGDSNQTEHEWSFWQYEGGYHLPGSGINGSNDRYAWDGNLNLKVGNNLDKNIPFFSVGWGKVVKWGSHLPGKDTYKSVLVEHNGYWSGYLHASKVNVREGDAVTPWTVLGYIGKAGATNDHLHFAVYKGKNEYKGLESFNVSFKTAAMTIQFGSISTIKIGQKLLLTGKGSCTAGTFDLNSQTYYNNTIWLSSNKNVLKVDGYGNITGVSPGTATITLYFCGAKASKKITVTK